MSQVLSDKKILAVSIIAATTTVIAGIMHLIMAPNSLSEEPGEGILFLVGGILQVFWAFPVMKRWGKIWQIIGIGGTIVFTGLWFGTHTHSLFGGSGEHMPGGPPPGNATQGGISQGAPGGEHFRERPRGIASIPQIEFFQIAFIALYITLAAMISKKKKITGEVDKKNR